MKIINKQYISALFLSLALASMSANAGKPGNEELNCDPIITSSNTMCYEELLSLCEAIKLAGSPLKQRNKNGMMFKGFDAEDKIMQYKFGKAEQKLSDLRSRLEALDDTEEPKRKIAEDDAIAISGALYDAQDCVLLLE